MADEPDPKRDSKSRMGRWERHAQTNPIAAWAGSTTQQSARGSSERNRRKIAYSKMGITNFRLKSILW